MAEFNEIEDIVVPDSPNVIEGQQDHIYVPVASYSNKGIALFDALYFSVINGAVGLSDKVKNELEAARNAMPRTVFDAFLLEYAQDLNAKFDAEDFDTKYFKITDGVVSFVQDLFDAKLNTEKYAKDNEAFDEEYNEYKQTVSDSLSNKANLSDGKVPTSELPEASYNTAGIASFDSSVFTVYGNRVSISDDFVNRFKEVVSVEDVTKLPAQGKLYTVYVAGGVMYYWDGSKYEKVKTVQVMEIAGIEAGIGEDSIQLGDGVAIGDNSIASGDADSELHETLVPTTIMSGTVPTHFPSTAKESFGIVHGLDNLSNTEGAVAIGLGNTAGATGYYWHSFGSNWIDLTLQRPNNIEDSVVWGVNTFDWESGDYICLVNVAKMSCVAEIDCIAGNRIYLKSQLPFTKDNYLDSDNYTYDYGTPDSPDERTVFAFKRLMPYSNLSDEHSTSIVPNELVLRKGAVKLGECSIALGIMNASAGPCSFIDGIYNVGVHDYNGIFGIANVGGYANIIGGWNNFIPGQYNLVGGVGSIGLWNANYNIIGGRNHDVKGNQNIIGGFHNAFTAAFNQCLIFGSGNIVGNHHTLMGGVGNTNTGIRSFLHGQKLNNSGAQSILVGESITNSGKNSHLFGYDLTNTGEASYVGGIDNDNTSKNTFIFGEGNTTTGGSDGWHNFIFGKFHNFNNPRYLAAYGRNADYEGAKNLGIGNPYLLIGNGGGTKGSTPGNAVVMTESGNAWFKGKMYAEGKIQKYTYGTELLTPGESSLETGTLYFAYE